MEIDGKFIFPTRRGFTPKFENVKANFPFVGGSESEDELTDKKRWIYPPKPKKKKPKKKSRLLIFFVKIFNPCKKYLYIVPFILMLFLVAMLSIATFHVKRKTIPVTIFPHLEFMKTTSSYGFSWSSYKILQCIWYTGMASIGYFYGFSWHEVLGLEVDKKKIKELDSARFNIKRRYSFILIGPYLFFVIKNWFEFMARVIQWYSTEEHKRLSYSFCLLVLLLFLWVFLFFVITRLAIMLQMAVYYEEAIQNKCGIMDPLKFAYLHPSLVPILKQKVKEIAKKK